MIRLSRPIALALSVLALLVVDPFVASAQPPPSLSEISERLDDLYRSRASIARMEIEIVTPNRTRSMRIRAWSRGENRSLIRIEAPARERGTATLRRDRNLWNFLPRISRTIRVPPSMMLSGWMGSDLTNDDLVRSSSLEDDFDGSVVGPDPEGRGWLIRYEARPGTVGLWRRIETVVNQAGTIPIESRYYDRRMRLARTMTYSEVREMDGRRIPTVLTIQPNDRPGHRTVMRYVDLDFDASVSESTFSLSELEQQR